MYIQDCVQMIKKTLMDFVLCHTHFVTISISAHVHTGRLCGRCEEEYSVAINSHYLECVPCSVNQVKLPKDG